ncbi:hypothetical protein Taro_027457 [Colocasia esculenta]|uniref:Transcription factor CBF/NF-Y/archaeal histone domain-containing protein n=1 Tax=Colocasia esculenta TaxID=4460 RepID=A0A843V8R6_COLES|nr:hypothetical protein [Colocasia esculenta]
MADSDNDSGGRVSGGGGGEFSSMREQERLLPIANVSRIMKRALPANAKVSKDAKETVQECVSEFISFVTGEASDKCQREKRKTVNGDDLLWAMATLGFDAYVDPLRGYLQRFREAEGDKSGGVGVGAVAATPSSSSSSQSLQQMDGAGGMVMAGQLPVYGAAAPGPGSYEYRGMGMGMGGDGGSGGFGGGSSAGIGFGGQR